MCLFNSNFKLETSEFLTDPDGLVISLLNGLNANLCVQRMSDARYFGRMVLHNCGSVYLFWMSGTGQCV